MSKFHKVKIKKIKQETKDCVTVSLDIPNELRETFTFKQGQYLTFKRVEKGDEIRRSYSICSSPLENEWKVAIKKIPEGRFSNFAHSLLKEGEEIEVLPPQGRFFTELNKHHKKNYVAFAAGSGITPVISIIKTILFTEPDSFVTLIYGNKGRNSIIFKEEIEALKNRFVERFCVLHILSREQGDAELLFGRIDQQKTKLILEKIVHADKVDEWFICGPQQMVNAVKEVLGLANVKEQKIHFELFTANNQSDNIKTKSVLREENGDRKTDVLLRLDGSFRKFIMSYYGDTILEAALAEGLDMPYSCKGGMCSTCRAKLISGQVEMDVNYSLEPAEVAAGYILTCQAHPITSEIEVDYDQ